MDKSNENALPLDSENDSQPLQSPSQASEEINTEKRIVVVGVGNGGCNVVAHMARQRHESPELLAINTDATDSLMLPGLKYVKIGNTVMKGMETGGDPRVGHRAAESDIESLRDLFKNTDLCFLVVGLGGGTGTGAAPIVIEAARDSGALTLCFAMLPFAFEGKLRMQHANSGLMNLQNVSDGVICIPNQRLFKSIEQRTSLAEAFKKVDETISRGVYLVWREMCRRTGVKGIHLSFDDLKTLINNSNGRCVFACARGSGINKVDTALKEIRNNPLLKEGKVMENAYAFMVSIIGGPDLSLLDVNKIIAGIPYSDRKQALMKTGVSCDPEWKNKVSITLLVSEKEGVQEHQTDDPEWIENGLDESENDTTETDASDVSNTAFKRSEKGKQRKMRQAGLFESSKHGRFKGITPTIIDGSNLDIPTYIRRNIRIQKPKLNIFENQQ